MYGYTEDKQDKKEQQIQDFIYEHNLSSLSEKDAAAAQEIIKNLSGIGTLGHLNSLLLGKFEDVAKIAYLRAISEQNWIIINQLDRLNKKLLKAFDLEEEETPVFVKPVTFIAKNGDFTDTTLLIGKDLEPGNYTITGSGQVTLYGVAGTALSKSNLSAAPVSMALRAEQKIECIGHMTLQK